jgi:hypothetical protein
MDRLPKLKAELMLTQAQVGALPYMRQPLREAWYDRQIGLVEPAEEQAPAWSPFRWNGTPVTKRQLKQRVGEALGAGLSE